MAAARFDGPEGDEYLDAIARETLRVRPVVFDVGRILTQPVEIAGYRLPAGVMVAPGIGLVHADPERYPDPQRFDPDRMMGGNHGPHHLAALRRRQPALPRRDVRAGGDDRGAAGDTAARRSGDHHRARRAAARQARHPGAAPRCTHHGAGGPPWRPGGRRRMPGSVEPVDPPGVAGSDQVDDADRVGFAPFVPVDESRRDVANTVAPQPCPEIVQLGWAEAVRRVEDLAERREARAVCRRSRTIWRRGS